MRFIVKHVSLVCTFALLAALTTGCDEAAPTASASLSLETPIEAQERGSNPSKRSDHRVSVGGADVCEALGLPTGCDANYSLTATVDADGNARGQWQDTFAGGGLGQHSAIDCVNIQGNTAVIGGVVTHGTDGFGNDVTGFRSLTAVVDNGTSQQDPADQISGSFMAPSGYDCHAYSIEDFEVDGVLYDLTHGQVTIR